MKGKQKSIWLIGPLLSCFFSFFPLIALAGDTTSCSGSTILLQVPLGGFSAVPNFGCYLQLLYKFSIGIVGIVGITMVMIGGVRWITAAGNPSKVQQGKDYIFSAIVGIILLLGAYTILNFINPQLTNVGIDISGVNAPQAASLLAPPPAPPPPPVQNNYLPVEGRSDVVCQPQMINGNLTCFYIPAESGSTTVRGCCINGDSCYGASATGPAQTVYELAQNQCRTDYKFETGTGCKEHESALGVTLGGYYAACDGP